MLILSLSCQTQSCYIIIICAQHRKIALNFVHCESQSHVLTTNDPIFKVTFEHDFKNVISIQVGNEILTMCFSFC